ncbi:unnamed protein product [Fusarium graminearum]|nr:unnamed protein product [Fusarium graminearum]VTO84553.1 unnamed protein product [Fusarium graminearum]
MLQLPWYAALRSTTHWVIGNCAGDNAMGSMDLDVGGLKLMVKVSRCGNR